MRQLILFLATAGVLLGQCVAPYSVEQLETLLRGGVLPVRVRALVRQCGVEFAVTPAVERRLRQAGATDAVLEAVREKGGAAAPPAAKPVAAPFGMEFVRIPAGEFLMGCSPGDNECDGDERPPHRVRISKPFEMGKYEVTQAQWEAVMGSNPSHFKGPDRPVENVSWNDAQEFITRLNARSDGYRYRLPTEAEWEYAARAGATSKHYGDLGQIAWYADNSGRQPLDSRALWDRNPDDYVIALQRNGNQTQPVGRKQPNAWGLHEMLGNVWEWCGDWYAAGYYASSPQADPRGPDSGEFRSLRGGSWVNNPWDLRVSVRGRITPGNRSNDNGFRLLRERFP